MKTTYVTTPDNIQVEYRLAGAGSRIGAAVIDSIIQTLVFIIVLLFSYWVMNGFMFYTVNFDEALLSNFAAIVIISYFIIFFGYFLLSEIVMKGQTLGKRVFGLRTIRQNGQPITFIQSIIRNIVRVMIDNLGPGVIVMMFSKDYKRLGDMLAGTMVISENPGKYTTKSLTLESPTSYEKSNVVNPAYPIESGEYELLKDYFARKNEFINNGNYAEFRVADYFAGKFNVAVSSMNDDFLKHIMAENAGNYS